MTDKNKRTWMYIHKRYLRGPGREIFPEGQYKSRQQCYHYPYPGPPVARQWPCLTEDEPPVEKFPHPLACTGHNHSDTDYLRSYGFSVPPSAQVVNAYEKEVFNHGYLAPHERELYDAASLQRQRLKQVKAMEDYIETLKQEERNRRAPRATILSDIVSGVTDLSAVAQALKDFPKLRGMMNVATSNNVHRQVQEKYMMEQSMKLQYLRRMVDVKELDLIERHIKTQVDRSEKRFLRSQMNAEKIVRARLFRDGSGDFKRLQKPENKFRPYIDILEDQCEDDHYLVHYFVMEMYREKKESLNKAMKKIEALKALTKKSDTEAPFGIADSTTDAGGVKFQIQDCSSNHSNISVHSAATDVSSVTEFLPSTVSMSRKHSTVPAMNQRKQSVVPAMNQRKQSTLPGSQITLPATSQRRQSTLPGSQITLPATSQRRQSTLPGSALTQRRQSTLPVSQSTVPAINQRRQSTLPVSQSTVPAMNQRRQSTLPVSQSTVPAMNQRRQSTLPVSQSTVPAMNQRRQSTLPGSQLTLPAMSQRRQSTLPGSALTQRRQSTLPVSQSPVPAMNQRRQSTLPVSAMTERRQSTLPVSQSPVPTMNQRRQSTLPVSQSPVPAMNQRRQSTLPVSAMTERRQSTLPVSQSPEPTMNQRRQSTLPVSQSPVPAMNQRRQSTLPVSAMTERRQSTLPVSQSTVPAKNDRKHSTLPTSK